MSISLYPLDMHWYIDTFLTITIRFVLPFLVAIIGPINLMMVRFVVILKDWMWLNTRKFFIRKLYCFYISLYMYIYICIFLYTCILPFLRLLLLLLLFLFIKIIMDSFTFLVCSCILWEVETFQCHFFETYDCYFTKK